jgi:hypothetical protein
MFCVNRLWSGGLRSDLLLPVIFSFAFASHAAAGETVDRNNLIVAPIEIRNTGAAPVLCQAEIAHWFAADLARIEPGYQADLGLRFDTATAAWATINARGEALPVERAWCGVEGRTYETRWNLYLARDRPPKQSFDCVALEESLACR